MAKRGSYVSTKTGKRERYDSNYELVRMRAFDGCQDIETWTKAHGIRIRYRLRRRWRTYIPDFLVTYRGGRRVLEEVKGKIWKPMEFIHKNAFATVYCLTNGLDFRLVFEEDLEDVAYVSQGEKRKTK